MATAAVAGITLAGRNVVVVGATGSVGSEVVRAAVALGANVLAVARKSGPLQQLAREAPGIRLLATNATLDRAPAEVFHVLLPEVLVLTAGAPPPAGPLYQLQWDEFCVNWHSDVKITFQFLQAVLTRPLAPGTTVIVVASGAAIAGSPNSGGYAGAKRTQMFMANYAQKESDRLGLGLRFATLAPRIMPNTRLGRNAVEGYAHYLGITAADFVRSMESSPTPLDVAAAVLQLARDPDPFRGRVLTVDAAGVKLVA
jgi:NADP-dependent 3-hydroxy acid dehydrogenase YdfG